MTTELDLRYIALEDFSPAVLNERGAKYYEYHDELPKRIILTLEQKRALRSPFFQPYNEWKGVPLVVK